MLDLTTLNKKKVDELKALCKERKLKTSGKKADLVERITIYETKLRRGPPAVEQMFSREKICLVRNDTGFFVHDSTGFVFDEATKQVAGVFREGEIKQLEAPDVEVALKWLFQVKEDAIKAETRKNNEDRLEELLQVMRGEKDLDEELLSDEDEEAPIGD